MKRIYILLSILTGIVAAADTSPQKGISLKRYLGRWYEQARYENWFEKGMEGVYTDYLSEPGGNIKVINSGRNSSGKLEQATGKAFPINNGVLEVSFVWPYWWFGAPYHILYVDTEYKAALVSGEDDEYLWLLTRERKPEQKTIERLKQEARRRGFDTTKLRFTKQ